MPQRWVYCYYPFETSPPPFYRMAVQFVCPRPLIMLEVWHISFRMSMGEIRLL
jgi:hypothetical protein